MICKPGETGLWLYINTMASACQALAGARVARKAGEFGWDGLQVGLITHMTDAEARLQPLSTVDTEDPTLRRSSGRLGSFVLEKSLPNAILCNIYSSVYLLPQCSSDSQQQYYIIYFFPPFFVLPDAALALLLLGHKAEMPTACWHMTPSTNRPDFIFKAGFQKLFSSL